MSGVKLGNPAPLGLLAFGMTVSVCGSSLGGMMVWYQYYTTTYHHLSTSCIWYSSHNDCCIPGLLSKIDHESHVRGDGMVRD